MAHPRARQWLLLRRAAAITLASLGTEHPQTQQFRDHYKTLLAHLHPNGEIEALLHRLVQQKQNDSQKDELSS
ncbi:hypothetical protein KSF_088110 [Reticulibacter mediterranei]|uniref:Uncharacterized protein n=1 Tax=Reticulibacter mediterranei TaxID=2778369 RepID=A0A8J3IR62_9CHLR|nr:hypothetical protein KSF_088110 [Reticulibacter mediterranei]